MHQIDYNETNKMYKIQSISRVNRIKCIEYILSIYSKIDQISIAAMSQHFGFFNINSLKAKILIVYAIFNFCLPIMLC